MGETPSSPTISTKHEWLAKLAKERPDEALTTLAHVLDLEWLREAHRRTRKDGARGVDGQSAEQYAEHLEDNLRSLLDRAKSGAYRAPPVRRVHIPKGEGAETRPLGIPTFEDKVLQRAVAMVLEAVYEPLFVDGSYGFRPGRSAHDALEALREGLMAMAGGWIVEVDIVKFFDRLDHEKLGAILRRRVRDGVLLRLIGKWLKAGVLEAGEVAYPEAGSPQGGVISPILANVYLHEVVDVWFEREVKPRLAGPAFLVRYADDIALVFRDESDARRVLAVLARRFARYGLALHPEKTRLVAFRRPPRGPAGPGASGPTTPGTFDLLGFTHHWARSRQGNWVIKRTTSQERFSRTLKRIAAWCRLHRHDRLEHQAQGLSQKLRGHFGYFGIRGNAHALARLRDQVVKIWRKWLDRRSQKAKVTWERMAQILRHHPLPPARLSAGRT
jgi:RNA-directed DNA polymerase